MVAFALGYALQASHRSLSTPTAQDTDVRPSADGLTGLPSDYVDNSVSNLGPSLPGDLGRAILHAQGQEKVASGTEDHRAAQRSRRRSRAGCLCTRGSVTAPANRRPRPGRVLRPLRGGRPPRPDHRRGTLPSCKDNPIARRPAPIVSCRWSRPASSRQVTVIAGALKTKISSDRPGLSFTFLVGHDLLLKPYRYQGHI